MKVASTATAAVKDASARPNIISDEFSFALVV
jgi:hypothetical protein